MRLAPRHLQPRVCFPYHHIAVFFVVVVVVVDVAFVASCKIPIMVAFTRYVAGSWPALPLVKVQTEKRTILSDFLKKYYSLVQTLITSILKKHYCEGLVPANYLQILGRREAEPQRYFPSHHHHHHHHHQQHHHHNHHHHHHHHHRHRHRHHRHRHRHHHQYNTIIVIVIVVFSIISIRGPAIIILPIFILLSYQTKLAAPLMIIVS